MLWCVKKFERKFEIVRFAENARVGLQGSATESWHLPRHFAPSFVGIEAELTDRRPFDQGEILSEILR
jgi:hypothetical protein